MKPSRSFERSVELHFHAPVTQVFPLPRKGSSECDCFDSKPRTRTMGTQTDPVVVTKVELHPPDPNTWKGWAMIQARKLRPLFNAFCTAALFIANRINFGIPIRFGGINRD